MTPAILLDTCALIWMVEGNLPAAIAAMMERRVNGGETIHISPISAWELGMLASRGRLSLPLEPLHYFRLATALPGIGLAPLTPEILVACSYLPDFTSKDPGDRILAATARLLGYVLMTRDRRLLEYGSAGHLRTIAC